MPSKSKGRGRVRRDAHFEHQQQHNGATLIDTQLASCGIYFLLLNRNISCLIRSHRSAPRPEASPPSSPVRHRNKTRKCAPDSSPGCNLKALYLCKNKGLPAALLPAPTSLPGPHGTCGSLFQSPHRGPQRLRAGAPLFTHCRYFSFMEMLSSRKSNSFIICLQ